MRSIASEQLESEMASATRACARGPSRRRIVKSDQRDSGRSASVGETGGVGARRHRREQNGTPEASGRSVHAAGAAVKKEGAERGSESGKHGSGQSRRVAAESAAGRVARDAIT
jgi:hypothetical protein